MHYTRHSTSCHCVPAGQILAYSGRWRLQQFVAEPVVASCVVESNFKLLPRTVEEVGPLDILLDQQRNTAGCKNMNKCSKTQAGSHRGAGGSCPNFFFVPSNILLPPEDRD